MSDTTLYDDTYTGPRFTYALINRPLAYGAQPKDFIVFSLRDHPKYRHGTIQYPRELTDEECRAYELRLVGLVTAPRKKAGRWVSPSQPGDWWTGAEAENGYAPHDAYPAEED
jgi:hypothetical protein